MIWKVQVAGEAFVPYSEEVATRALTEQGDPKPGTPVAGLGDEALERDTSDEYPVDITMLTVRNGSVIYLALTMRSRTTKQASQPVAPLTCVPPEGHRFLGGMEIQIDQCITAGEE